MSQKQINPKSIQFDGIDHGDYPDYCDAYICYAEYEDGTELTDEELDKLSDDRDYVYEQLQEYLT